MFIVGHWFHYSLLYSVLGFFITTLLKPYSESKNPTRWGLIKGNTYRLSGNVVEVDEVADGVDGGEEEGRARADLVELEAWVQRDVLRITIMVMLWNWIPVGYTVHLVVWWIVNLMEGMLFELGDEVLADGEEEKAVAEGERVGSASCDSDPHLWSHIFPVQQGLAGEVNGERMTVW